MRVRWNDMPVLRDDNSVDMRSDSDPAPSHGFSSGIHNSQTVSDPAT
jgi:hypothetical protein